MDEHGILHRGHPSDKALSGETTFDANVTGRFAEGLGSACECSRRSNVIEAAKIAGIRRRAP